MVGICERNKQILDYIVRDYVKNGSPVASGRISEKFNFRLSPATVRSVMIQLEEDGFLEKEHHSSGRVPTDKSYRYFVDNCMARMAPEHLTAKNPFEKILKEKEEARESKIDSILNEISKSLGIFTSIGYSDSKKIFTKGSEKLLKEPEFRKNILAGYFGFVIDHLEEIMKEMSSYGNREIAISIGKENPFKETRMFGILSGSFENHQGEEYIMFSLGPRRMDYEKSYSLMSFTANCIIPEIKK